ncbi:MAG TPA: xanthine dehydrogenase family protein molybdopterin-binding subunit [Ktedonobacteraceae bacterium]|nr:xanthine dehydrogenase family protein molybdopterin-binding subunit [Ktedonobacteraceae bacterium]
MAQTVEQTSSHTSIGHSTRRQDGFDKVAGNTRYAGDLPLVGLLHARLVLSPYAHARILRIDTDAALRIPGVKAVYTSKTLGIVHPDNNDRSRSPLAEEEVLWCGHPVAIVLAESEEAARDGVDVVDVEYEELPVVLDPLAAMQPGAPLTRLYVKETASEIAGGGAHAAVSKEEVAEVDTETLSENVSDKAHMHEGDMEAGWREAEVVVERTYYTSSVHQSYIEPQSITVAPGISKQHLLVWPSSQGMFGVRSSVAQTLDLPERQVRVESTPIGGAFGGKFGLLEPLAAAAAYTSGKPVRLVLSRSDDLFAGNPAPQSMITLKLGAKRDGTLVAMQAKVVFNTGAYGGSAVFLGGLLLGSSYRCPNFDFRCYEVMTNTVGVGAYRAPAAPQATFALESAVDELCHALGMDPVEFRLKNGVKEGDPSLMSKTWPRIGLLECLEKAQAHPLWAQRAAHSAAGPAELNGWKIGVGIAAGGWPGGTEPTAAACRLESDGTVSIVVGTVDLTGSDTSLALIASEALGVSADAVRTAHDNTDTMPYSGGTGGSKTTYSMGAAVLAAARDARSQILSIASEMLEAATDDLDIEGDKVIVRGAPGKSVELKQIAGAAMQFAGRYEPVYGRGRAALKVSSPMFAVHVARVAVDPETGIVRVLDYVAAQDVGFAINPAEVEGQISGGVTQGLGWALYEGYVYDENGQLLTSNFMDYALPHTEDVPHIATLLVEIPSALGPYGAKGVGEPPVVPVSAAIANAIYDAVGARVTRLPITPERLFMAMQ